MRTSSGWRRCFQPVEQCGEIHGHGGRIAVTAQRDGRMVGVAVQDTGIGIPAEMLTQVFEPFTQLDRSLDGREAGWE